MTFDGFDAAVLIEPTAFSLSLPAAEEPTLEEALAEDGDAGDTGATTLRPLNPDELLLLAGG